MVPADVAVSFSRPRTSPALLNPHSPQLRGSLCAPAKAPNHYKRIPMIQNLIAKPPGRAKIPAGFLAILFLCLGVVSVCGQGFTNINGSFPPLLGSTATWGDYDNDGRLDLLFVGNPSSGTLCQLWRNTAAGFTNVPIAGITTANDALRRVG